MSMIFLQLGFLIAYFCLMILIRKMARDRLRNAEEEKRKLRESLEWERKVGIPYDPSNLEKHRQIRR